MKTNDIRTKFLEYFKNHDHTEISSSPLIPKDDKTLLFTNAGMVQFKCYFLGVDKPAYNRAVSSQCCIRAGGKHNDLENVGYTKRHHTFFEMLGNFSFGDYFKKEAIQYSWEFITKELNIPAEKLWITVYEDDNEAADIWLNDIGVDSERLSYCGEKDNFWSMGAVGPCGPCTEIFYDHGDSISGGPPGSSDEDGDRYVEIWNLVFMEFERTAEGKLQPLPMKSVDTGMGLERISAVMQNVHDNYEIDLFKSMITSFKKILKIEDDNLVALKVIADHIRSIVFLMAEGVQPNNDGRGYVLRRIIRRAIRYGTKLGLHGEFIYKLVEPLIVEMGEHYPIIVTKQKSIEKIIRAEEEQFGRTLHTGLKILEKDIASIKSDVIPGELIFKMYDTYGFPVDLLQDIAKEHNLNLDLKGYNKCMESQRSLARNASSFGLYKKSVEIQDDVLSDFTGYENLQEKSKVTMLLQEGKSIAEINDDSLAGIVLEKTPFYAESGGQVGDTGIIKADGFEFAVTDTQKIKGAIIHYGNLLSGTIKLNEHVVATIDQNKRLAIKNNHTATHLLHAALKQILGKHSEQKGSIVTADKLRFDFTHSVSLTDNEIVEIENLVNKYIRLNKQVNTDIKSFNDAIEFGAVALFGEKYQDSVRVVSVDSFSKELCGGTHVTRTGDIGIFKIINEYSIATGIRRIDAITGKQALNYIQQTTNKLSELIKTLNTSEDGLLVKAKQLIADNKSYKKEIDKLSAFKAKEQVNSLSSKAEKIGMVNLLATIVDNVDGKNLKIIVDDILNRYENRNEDAIVVLVSKLNNKINVVCKLTKSCIGIVEPQELIRIICGKGGGREDMAQGGSSIPNDLEKRLALVKDKLFNSADKYRRII